MHKEVHQWHSPALNKTMEIAVYGHYGSALLLLPTAGADYLEYERFDLIKDIEPFINSGTFKVFSINSINNESWLNDTAHPRWKAVRHQQFNQYVFDEVVPFIRNLSSTQTPIYTAGASFGALHAANLFFRRPDLIQGCIAMSGVYKLSEYTKGYYDDDVYFNSPEDYLPNLHDEHLLQLIKQSQHIHILAGSGNYEDPNASRRFSAVLNAKNITHELDIWGWDIDHDWQTWRKMLPLYLATRF